MRPLRYSINVTLDGCCDHEAGSPTRRTHEHAAETLERADALIFGRVVYQMMEEAFREPAESGECPNWMEPWMMPFAQTIHAAKKYVVSRTLEDVDWNAELVRDDLVERVGQLKQEPGDGLLVGGVQTPLALAEHDLIDEYELVVHPTIAGHGPTLFAGLTRHVELELVDRIDLGSGVFAMQYQPVR